ncbi:mechanosensitive ion channel family protein [Salinirussus salinus]|jgi:small-conductance mechanosensitive channel|uniref:mechanosensitive ion channel family protein n=1 Tax=Salinirussus salinus TaxID=1198300 RepID=UPI001359CA1E|nr:mechanosensitive ion channel domain-containing protein [Salinirussus salinus]
MGTPVSPSLLATATETPVPVGAEGLVDYWPVFVRLGWFLAGALVVLVVGWYVFVPAVLRTVRRRNRNNRTIQEAFTRYTRLLVVVLAVVVGAGVAGYGGVLADSALVVAAATLAVGVAGQTVLGSLVSGLVLVLDPEFNVGDYIEWDGGEGTVRSITLRVTRVQTVDGGLVTVPNTVLTDQAVARPYGRSRHRIVERLKFAYEADAGEALGELEAAAAEVAGIAEAPDPAAYLEEFGSDAVVARIHYWVDDPSEGEVIAVRSAYARAVKRRLEAADITLSPASKRELQGRVALDREG